MAESVVTFLLRKLGSLVEEESKLLGGVKGEFLSIRDELESMKAFLRNADAIEESDPEIHAWVKQVREVAYDTEDVLDEFMLRFAPHRHHRHGFFGSVYKIYYQIKNMKARHQIASEIRDIKGKVKDIAERRQRYGFNSSTSEQGSSSNTWYDRRGDALLLEEDDLVGIEKPKQQLINWVLDGDSRLKVISVLGMGGLGKTTLVKKVYEDAKVETYFQNHAWITVSQSFKIEELLTDLIQQLFHEVRQPLPQRFETMDNNKLKAVLREFLQESRYVLVLDDIWSIDAWDAIKIALPNRNCGSRVLLTTRIGNVSYTSSRESHGYIYEMKALSEEESWTLFCKKTFQEKDCPPHLKELSERFLKRCEGLPLAIVVIARVLASKVHNRVEWTLADRNLGAEVEGSGIKKILLLGYSDLPYYLKSCFLYLSIFPEDHKIEWTSSIRLWIAEGFVEAEQGKTLEEVAETYFYELLNRNLIQIAQRRHGERIRNCHIHDLLREIILSKSRDQNFLAIAGEENVRWPVKVRRLSIHNTLQNIPQGECLSRLRSLLMFGVDDSLSESSMPLLFNGGLRLLEVLDLRGASLKTFPNEVVKLFHLKYLSLRGREVKVIPNSIGKLQNLETLDLKHTCVTELPVEILRLHQLRYLLLHHIRAEHFYYFQFHCRHGFTAPSKVGDLQSLQKLSYIEANHGTIVQEIGRLTQLRRLSILKLRQEDGVALCSSIRNLSNLRSLFVSSVEEDEILDLQSLSLSLAPRFLQRLFLRGRLEKFPHWISSLHDLSTLNLEWSKLRDDPLQFLQDLPNLVRFKLFQDAYEGEGLCFKAGKFQSLRNLILNKLKGLRWVTVEEGTMPRLENLFMASCELVEELPFGIEHLSNLKHLELIDLSDELVSKPNPNIQGGDFYKIAHIPSLWIGHLKDGYWKDYYQ